MSEKSAEKIVIPLPVPTMAFLCDGISHMSLVHSNAQMHGDQKAPDSVTLKCDQKAPDSVTLIM